MMKQKLLFLFLAIAFFSCKRNEDAPYITFRNAMGDIITSDAWNVNLDTTERLYIECGFVEGGYIFYERQIDNNPNIDLIFDRSNDIIILSNNEIRNNLRIEKAVISTTFNRELMSHGSEVKIGVRDRSKMAKTFTYIVR